MTTYTAEDIFYWGKGGLFCIWRFASIFQKKAGLFLLLLPPFVFSFYIFTPPCPMP
jgi:hypothetical protein